MMKMKIMFIQSLFLLKMPPGLTATQLSAVNALTPLPVDASAVTSLNYDTIGNINTLLLSGLDSAQTLPKLHSRT